MLNLDSVFTFIFFAFHLLVINSIRDVFCEEGLRKKSCQQVVFQATKGGELTHFEYVKINAVISSVDCWKRMSCKAVLR